MTQKTNEHAIPRFRAAAGLGNPHLQTILGKFLRPRLELPTRRERVETPDGDFVDLDFAADGERAGTPADDDDARPVVLVLHGLEGAATRRYMLTTYRALLERGLRPVGLNFRGCSGEPNRTPRAYHSGDTADARFVLELLRERFHVPLGIIGYSLGGNVTLKLLGELGRSGDPLVDAAAAVSVPFDLSAGSDRIQRGVMGRIYTTYFMRGLRRKVALKADLMRDVCDPAAVARTRTLREFDDMVTAPLHGFDGAEDYYQRSSSAGFIADIRTPTLIIHAQDDPFLPSERIPRAAMDANPAVTAVLPRRGGHVGFIAGSVLRPRFWLEPTLADFLARRLTAHEGGAPEASAPGAPESIPSGVDGDAAGR